jgi:hypothetical protein
MTAVQRAAVKWRHRAAEFPQDGAPNFAGWEIGKSCSASLALLTSLRSAYGRRASLARSPDVTTSRAYVARGDSSPGGANFGTDFRPKSGQNYVEPTLSSSPKFWPPQS